MSRPRDIWWGYVRNILRTYPEVTQEEEAAVHAAVQATKQMDDGAVRLKMVDAVFFRRTHTLEGAAQLVSCSYATAKRWQQDFIREVARNYRCEKGLVAKR